jgi:hypothetical protein
MRRLTPRRPSPALVVALVALFVSLGGGAYAALHITSRDIANNTIRSIDVKNGSLTGKDVKNNSLGGTDVIESKLGKVRKAGNADTVGGRSAASLVVGCPAGTVRLEGMCFESAARPAQTFFNAARTCTASARRLPTPGELVGLGAQPSVTLSGFELTSDVSHSGSTFSVITVSDAGVLGSPTTTTARPFRCVAPLAN